MDENIARLKQNIARIRRDVRLQAFELQQLIDADLDCTCCAQRLMRMQADLIIFLEKRDHLLERVNEPAAQVYDPANVRSARATA
jgi:hypothetical protein